MAPKFSRVHRTMLRLLALVDGAMAPRATRADHLALYAALEALAERAQRRRRRAPSTRYTMAQRRIWASYTPAQRAARVERMRAGR